MSIKTKIKNDLWRVNYIVPFTKKYLADEKGKADLAKRIVRTYMTIRPVKGTSHKRTVGGDIKALLGKVDMTIPEKGFVYFLDTTKTIAVKGNIISNFTIDYSKLLRHPFNDLVSEVNADGVSDEYGNEINIVAEGIEALRTRIVSALKGSDLNKEDKGKRLSEFEHILDKPVVGFEEALQRVLFFNQIMWQTRHRLNGLGRMDYYLYEYYEKDLSSGKLNSESVDKLLDDFFEKLSRYSSYKSDALEGDIGQIIILGGLNPDGTYFCNELTEKFLKAQARSKKPDPKTFLRVSKLMPKSLMETAVECLKSSTGSPLFSNDDVVIPQLKEFGMPDEDAYSYCVSACWEPFIVGKSFDQNNMAVYDYSLPFDELMNSNEDILDFGSLVNKYIDLNEKCFQAFLCTTNELKWAKDPLVSLLTEGCNETRTDVADGGAKYTNFGITTVGLSNVVDSLLNLKKLIYDDKRYTLIQMADMRKNDFKGSEEVYSFCQGTKHYGHDDDDAIQLVNRITESLSSIACGFKNKYGGTVKFGLSSPAYNMLNKKTMGDFSGRKAGMPYSTHISCTDSPYTEVVNFAGRLGYDKQRFNGNVVDFFVSPGFLTQNKDKFVLFMMVAIKQGFFQMQMNIMDSNTLIEAKKHPENYPGLIVRVWGFSAYFNDLPESYKDLLINRALAAERIA